MNEQANLELRPDLFQPVARSRAEAEKIARPSTTFWSDSWRRLRGHRMGMLGLTIIVLIVLAAVVGPYLLPYGYADQDLKHGYEAPSSLHWFGTDNLGRDLLVRTLYGARISLGVGFGGAFLVLVIGVLYGTISGFFGGMVDEVMMRVVDIIYSVPTLLYVILLMVILKPGLRNIYIAIAIAQWVQMARVVRGETLSLKEREFVLAARTIGASKWRIMLYHLIPNALGPIIVTATLAVPEAIFLESFLSFIGLGVSAPMASWGVMASEALSGLRSYPHLLLFPAGGIALTMLGFNFLGDGLRDALDPRMRR